MKYLLGQKQEMTQLYDQKGAMVSVTIVKVEPNRVTRVKSNDKDGYAGVQIAAGQAKRRAKPQSGFFEKLGMPLYRVMKEVRYNTRHGNRVIDSEAGSELLVNQFIVGDYVTVRGITKGKGFQGVVKRHGFSGGPASHGHKDQERMPGSIGSTGPQEVFKGKKMAGHMGSVQVTVRGLEVMKIDEARNVLYIKGGIPGARHSWVEIIQE
ncbi:MAG TPA: 50S ribosomal protein L3 [Patescibacteria group bacterium]|nr:50S ribosomal protein L3 [Patescibacteria group bacterium]